MPSPARFVRQMAVFVRNQDGSWRRDNERHDNVLIDTGNLPALLADHHVDATVTASFGSETLPIGLRAVVGRRDAAGARLPHQTACQVTLRPLASDRPACGGT